MKKIFDWLDNRTGYRKITEEALHEPIPGGARWRYIWGSTLTFAIAVQFITGIFL
ncbi:MAG: ubiquinol-cytochrome c reductase cytochrome b subunit, partial [Limisphaerales bacterium]